MPKTRAQIEKQYALGNPTTPPVALPTITTRQTRNKNATSARLAPYPSTAAGRPARSPIDNTTDESQPTRSRRTNGARAPATKAKRGRKAKAKVEEQAGLEPTAEPAEEPAPEAERASVEPTAESSSDSTPEPAQNHEQGNAEDTNGHERNDTVRSSREKPLVSFPSNTPPVFTPLGQGPVGISPYGPIYSSAVTSSKASSSGAGERVNIAGWRDRNGRIRTFSRAPFTFGTPDDPNATPDTVYVLVRGPDEERSLAFNIPQKALRGIITDLTAKYGTIEDPPKLTLSTENSKTIRVENTQTGTVATYDDAYIRGEYYQTRQDKPGHTQKYRKVNPTYDENGNYTNEALNGIFVPIDDEDDSDLDTELDNASSSFKENIPLETGTGTVEGEPSPAIADTTGAGTLGPGEGALVLREDPTPRIPETPRTRSVLGNLLNTASRFIPRLGRVAGTRAPTANLAPAEVPVTPPHSASHPNHLPPQTEPHRPTQLQTPSAEPDVRLNRAATGYKKQTGGHKPTKEDLDRFNVQRRLQKSAKRKEYENLQAKEAELEAKRAALQREEEALKMERELHDAHIAGNADGLYTSRYGFQLKNKKKLEKTREGALFGPPREPNAPGSRIAEARSEAKRKRRKSSPEVIPNPDGGGYGINDKYFFNSDSSDDDSTSTTSRGRKAPRLDDPRDSSLPVGDPHRARPATGAFVHDEVDEPQLHGGNIFRDVDADEETAAKAAKAKKAAPKLPLMTPNGIKITNLSGHFTVPSDSDSSSDEDVPTPAPKRSVKESLGEMSIFRGDTPSRPERPSPQKPVVPAGHTESIPPIPRAPMPSHATLPTSPIKSRAPPGKIGERTARFIQSAKAADAAKRKADQLERDEKADKADDSEGLKSARAKALQFTPRAPSNLRESHLVDSSPLVASETPVAQPSIATEERAQTPPPNVQEPSPSLYDNNNAAADLVSPHKDTIAQYPPDEMVCVRGLWVLGKVANQIAKYPPSEEQIDAMYLMIKDECPQYMIDNPTPPLFSERVEAAARTPEFRQAAEELGEQLVPEMENSFTRGWGV